MTQFISANSPREGDLILTIDRYLGSSDPDRRKPHARMFLYAGREDGPLILGDRGVELNPVAMNLGSILLPQPKWMDHYLWPDGYSRFTDHHHEVYVGLENVCKGLSTYEELEPYAAVAEYFLKLRPALSRFHEKRATTSFTSP